MSRLEKLSLCALLICLSADPSVLNGALTVLSWAIFVLSDKIEKFEISRERKPIVVIQALDAKSINDHSGEIADAVRKEMFSQ